MVISISAGTLFTGDEVINEAGITIKDGVIQEVGSQEDLPEDADYHYHLPEHTVIPGLIDGHTHITSIGEPEDPNVERDAVMHTQSERVLETFKNCQRTIEAGITTVRDLGGPRDISMAVRDEIAAGSFAGPRIVTAGEGLTSTGGHGDEHPWHLANVDIGRKQYVADGVSGVKQAVRTQLQRGADLIKVWVTGGVVDEGDGVEALEYSPEEIEAIVAEADRHGVPVASHAHTPRGIEVSIEAGVHSIEHGMYMDDRSIEMLIDSGTYLTLTMAVMETIRSNEYLADYLHQNADKAIDYQRSMLSAARDAGVNIAMGSDTGGYPSIPHGENTLELECMVNAGYSPQEALQVSTVATSDMLGFGDSLGQIAPDYIADIVAVEGDLLADITRLRDPANIDLVMVDGSPVKDTIKT